MTIPPVSDGFVWAIGGVVGRPMPGAGGGTGSAAIGAGDVVVGMVGTPIAGGRPGEAVATGAGVFWKSADCTTGAGSELRAAGRASAVGLTLARSGWLAGFGAELQPASPSGTMRAENATNRDPSGMGIPSMGGR